MAPVMWASKSNHQVLHSAKFLPGTNLFCVFFTTFSKFYVPYCEIRINARCSEK